MFPLWLLPLIGTGIGALTHLNDPKQMLKNAGIGAGIGGALGMGAPSLLGNAPQAMQLGASAMPGYSLTGAAQMPGMIPSLTGAGMSQLMGNPALMGVNPMMASASGGTVAKSGLPIESLLKIMQFAGNPSGQPQQKPAPVPQMSEKQPVPLLQRKKSEQEMAQLLTPHFSQDLWRLLRGGY